MLYALAFWPWNPLFGGIPEPVESRGRKGFFQVEFEVLRLTGRGNLLLAGPKAPAEHATVFLAGKPVARIFETIGRVDSPLFLARSLVKEEEAAGLVGKSLSVE